MTRQEAQQAVEVARKKRDAANELFFRAISSRAGVSAERRAELSAAVDQARELFFKANQDCFAATE